MNVEVDHNAPNYQQRLILQEKFEHSMIQDGEYGWGRPIGWYHDWAESIVPYHSIMEQINQQYHYLQNMEAYLAHLTRQYLDLKKGNEPTVMMDLGGGIGKTFARLALFFENEVRTSQLAFIVSNFRYEPEDAIEKTIWDSESEKKFDFKSSTINALSLRSIYRATR